MSFIRDGPKRDTKLLHLIYSNVCVLINVKSLGVDAYFVTFIDNASKKVVIFAYKEKISSFRHFS